MQMILFSRKPLLGTSPKQMDFIWEEADISLHFPAARCPVTTGLLLQPHLTSCCGQHLSEEAVSRIQGEGGACPLCNKEDWSTMFSKHFQRQVNSLRVFCRHKDRGCGWQGELASLDRHVTSCSMKDAPQIEEQPTLHANEDNKIIVAGVPILGAQKFWYTGKQMDFIWEEAGISLHFPAAFCERDIKISVGIFTDLEQNCILPQLMPRASSTYEIKASAPLPAPVRVRIEHCAIVEKENSLVHMVAHGGAPYQFKPLHGGHFPLNKIIWGNRNGGI
ncbi:hypothetical protein GBAR_LOCUS4297 [Geodia barretti]|uniref:Uncharacterized protein n=1 Tax=Geodia barretti TaxID=519541 RepID=A0AA35R675_GEOBA|nr:hypothetical protein GBAR_LOCUS4297 [Geodia barretti]